MLTRCAGIFASWVKGVHPCESRLNQLDSRFRGNDDTELFNDYLSFVTQSINFC